MGALVDVTRLPGVRRLELAWGMSQVGANSSTVALLIYSYAEGGATLLAVYSVGRALVGAITTVAVSGLGDRIRRDHLLRLTTGGSAVMLGVAAVVALIAGPSWLVVTLGLGSAALAGTFRPLQAAALPWLARTPAELASANVAATVMENAGSLVGPALAGAVLLVADAGTALAVAAGWLLLATFALVRLTLPEQSRDVASSSGRFLRGAVAGTAALWRIAPPGGVVALGLVQTFARGFLLVSLVVLALDVLRLGEDAVGWLNAVMGLGGVLGGALGAIVVRVSQLARSFLLGVVLWGVPLVLVALWPTAGAAYLAMLLIGLGNAFEDASMFTLLPRAVGARLAGRALGVLELLISMGLAAGSLLAPWLVTVLGTRGAFGAIGAALLAVSAVYTVQFVRLDRSMPAPGPELALVRGLPMFAPLPLVVVEQLTTALEPRDYQPGQVIIRQGEPGDRFHVVADGTADVRVGTQDKHSLTTGDCFGEIALLRDTPRTATVTATTPVRTLTLTREAFLTAVAGSHVGAASARALASARLASDTSGAEPAEND